MYVDGPTVKNIGHLSITLGIMDRIEYFPARFKKKNPIFVDGIGKTLTFQMLYFGSRNGLDFPAVFTDTETQVRFFKKHEKTLVEPFGLIPNGTFYHQVGSQSICYV